ncbi:hypothetical protein CLOSTASPAR_01503 [[Clostridium] asparagiforme DSM 15981]|uniref:Uncharacterized protein n=1 Tax=[Clostridium] asparagiforme DSM 15981 TaxID=518636 RepID=C0CWY2_9FIRM|nr:hypothetical protein CLOSTASPAR_01503 [[Clostridium] asparagiforme DSM 15981]
MSIAEFKLFIFYMKRRGMLESEGVFALIFEKTLGICVIF